jgi:hypothetical protein
MEKGFCVSTLLFKFVTIPFITNQKKILPQLTFQLNFFRFKTDKRHTAAVPEYRIFQHPVKPVPD